MLVVAIFGESLFPVLKTGSLDPSMSVLPKCEGVKRFFTPKNGTPFFLSLFISLFSVRQSSPFTSTLSLPLFIASEERKREKKGKCSPVRRENADVLFYTYSNCKFPSMVQKGSSVISLQSMRSSSDFIAAKKIWPT